MPDQISGALSCTGTATPHISTCAQKDCHTHAAAFDDIILSALKRCYTSSAHLSLTHLPSTPFSGASFGPGSCHAHSLLPLQQPAQPRQHPQPATHRYGQHMHQPHKRGLQAKHEVHLSLAFTGVHAHGKKHEPPASRTGREACDHKRKGLPLVAVQLHVQLGRQHYSSSAQTS
eukprot:706160-Pelagomonas_calceolata.AAC.2